MNLLSSVGLRARAVMRALTLSSADPALKSIFGAAPVAAGVSVTENTAFNYSAVWAAVALIAGSIGSLPLPLYRRLPEGGKERASSHPLYRLLHDEPNPEMTSMVFRETLQNHVLTWGNAYAEIERNGGGRPVALWPLTPDRLKVERDQAKNIVYRVRQAGGGYATLSSDNVLHVPGLGFDGLTGYAPIARAREAIGLGLATERFGASFFGRGSRPSGVLEHKGRLSDKARERLRGDWDSMHSGVDNAHRPAVLEEGMSWKALMIPPEDAQFLQTRLFQIQEVARWFNVPLHLLKDLSHATFSNIEHQALEFVVHTLRPWLVRWEQELNRKLLSSAERDVFFFEHLVDGLLRGDQKTRFEAHAIGRQWGWYSADDVLEVENRNPLPGGQGKLYLVPANMTTPEKLAAAPPPGSGGAGAPPASRSRDTEGSGGPAVQTSGMDPDRLAAAHRAVVLEVAGRLVKKEANALRRAAPRGLAGLEAWSKEFYPDHQEQLAAALLPAVTAHLVARGCAASPAAAAAEISAAHVEASRGDLAEDLAEAAKEQPGAGAHIQAVAGRVADRWEIARPGELADRVLARAAAPQPAPASSTVPQGLSLTINAPINVPAPSPTPVVFNFTPQLRAQLAQEGTLNVRMVDSAGGPLEVRLVAMPDRVKSVERDVMGKADKTVERDGR